MAVRLRSLLATWPRLRPLSWRACLTLPGRISTPRRRPRRLLGVDGCADTSDMKVSLTRASRHLTGFSEFSAAEMAASVRPGRDGRREKRHRRQQGGKDQLAHQRITSFAIAASGLRVGGNGALFDRGRKDLPAR